VGTFTARFIYFGFSFGEAAYAAQNSLSWQTTIVGDPLYRPFAQSAPSLHQELEQANSPLAAWSHLRVVNLNLARGTKPAEVAGYLTQLKLTESSPVLAEKLGDLYLQLGKPASANHACEQALNLATSPMQKARLRLQVGEFCYNNDEPEKAWQHFSDLLADWPDYADANNIKRKLLLLAKKLGREDEARKIEEELKRLTPAGAVNSQ
jgi:tetratricopeptide (TPR) repeat protein